MEVFIRYILISTYSLSVCYLGYSLFLRKETRFKYARYYLLISMVLALLMPFTGLRINLNFQPKEHENYEVVSQSENSDVEPAQTIGYPTKNYSKETVQTIYQLLIYLYFLGLSILISRLFVHLFIIFRLYFISEKTQIDNIPVLITDKTSASFSFFSWIFISDTILRNRENRNIVIHESIHASQYHSIDLLMIEILSAVMWFNPLMWMMKKSIQLVHEYLADKGVLDTGLDKLKYQALLINQIAEESLICLSSSFNHSLIKKRMIMMTNRKINQRSKLRILALMPVVTLLFIGVACINGQNKSNVVTAIEPVRMNVLYLGVDNPIKIAASGYDASDLTVSVDNGTISGNNGEYVIKPSQQGSVIFTVSSKGKEIQKTTFRVKIVPNPVAKVAGKQSGTILKDELLSQNEITAEIENFVFDLNFVIVGFKVTAVIDGYTREAVSNSNKFTDKQKELIAKTRIGSRIIFEDIKCMGPDGITRDLPPLFFRTVE